MNILERDAASEKIKYAVSWLDAEGIQFKFGDHENALSQLNENCDAEIKKSISEGETSGFVNSKFISDSTEVGLLGFWFIDMPEEIVPWIAIEATASFIDEKGEPSRQTITGGIRTQPFNLRLSLCQLKINLMSEFANRSFERHVEANDGDPLVYGIISKRVIDDDESTVFNRNGDFDFEFDLGIKGTELFDRRHITISAQLSEDDVAYILTTHLEQAYKSYLFRINETMMSSDVGQNLYLTNLNIGLAPPEGVN